MQSGTVKYYNSEKGYGFIKADKQQPDVFFHITKWQLVEPPHVGQKVWFDSEYNHENQLRATIVTTEHATITASKNVSTKHNSAKHTKPSSKSNTSAPKQKNWITTAVSALVLMIAVYFGGSNLLPNSAPNDSANNSPNSPTSSEVEVVDTFDTSNTSDSFTTVATQHGQASVTAITGDEQIDKTIVLIQQGGPFPYPEKDGTTFYNREGRLPNASRDYYREYTVPTPGVSHRGARRIVTGGNPPEVYYLTLDHYDTFTKLDVETN